MQINFFFKNLWRWKTGCPEINFCREDMDLLKNTEWSREFELLMRNRLFMGALRYGKINTEKPVYARIASIKKRLEVYKETKNKEMLIDIANLCLLEYVEGSGVLAPMDDVCHTEIK